MFYGAPKFGNKQKVQGKSNAKEMKYFKMSCRIRRLLCRNRCVWYVRRINDELQE